MNTTPYKGFNIVDLSERFYVTVVGSKSRGAEGFNPDGYATLNNAKGAITKHLKGAVTAAIATTADIPVAERMAAISTMVRGNSEQPADYVAPAPSWPYNEPRHTAQVDEVAKHMAKKIMSQPATSDGKDRASVPVDADLSANTAHLMQQLTYHGFLKHGKPVTSQKYLSRNKREGKYAGKIHGLHVRSRDKRFNGPSATNAGTVALYK